MRNRKAGDRLKAILLHQHGDLDVLNVEEIATPQPGPGEVQVKLAAAALNRLDLWVREGWPGLKLAYPHIPGADGAGEVAALGEGVSDLDIGQRVVINSNLSCGRCEHCLGGRDNQCLAWNLLGETMRGTYAEYVVVPATNLLPLPEHVSFGEAAAAGLVFHTAWHMLITRGRLRAGESVLVVGASGGVNTAAIQIARLSGAQVIAVGANARRLELAQRLGADQLIDRSQTEDWSKAVYQLTQRRGVDVVIDNVGAGSMPLSLRAVRKGGRILTVGNSGGPKFELDNRYIFGKHLSILGSTMGTRSDFNAVMDQIFHGRLKPVIGQRFPLDQAREAQACLASGEQMGKIVLDV
jgi:NADPH:quinone reductase-like Zn-dependent oxidoreductase